MNEGEWIEIPAHRIYVTTHELYHRDFDRLGKDGLLHREMEKIEWVVRKRDQKIFKIAPFQPSNIGVTNTIALVEA